MVQDACLTSKRPLVRLQSPQQKTMIWRGGVVGRSRWSEKPEALLSIELSPQVVFYRDSTMVSTGVSYASDSSSILFLGTRNNLCSLHETSVHETCKNIIIGQREISGTPYAMLQRQLNKCNDELQIILVKKIYGVIWKHACVKTGGRGSSPLYLQYLRKLQV